MADLSDILGEHVRNGALPGAVGLVARGGRTEVAAVGSASVGGPPMARDSIFRIASITKPITAASLMMLVDDGRIALDDPVGEWLPELAKPSVVRTPASEVDPWNVPGRYGWVGGTGTSAHIVPSTGAVAILLTQVAADSPVPPEWMRDFWRYAAS